MKSIDSFLRFQFKGDRNYVTGTDIFTKINEAALGEEGTFLARLKFVNLLKCNAMLAWVSAEKSQHTGELDPCAIGEIRLKSGQSKVFKVVPIPQKKISNRYEYLENQITSRLQIDQKTACLNDLTGFNLIEETVASIKYLSNLIAPPKSGKWLFVGIQVNEPMPAARNCGQVLRVTQRLIVANRFSKNDLYLGDSMLATVDFSVGGV